MSFDPSVLSDIGASGPDITGSMAKGFQLKDLVNEQQMSQLKLNSLKSGQADDEKAKGILSSSDLQTEKGLATAQEKLTRAGLPQKAMDLRKYGQSVTSGELDMQRQKVELHSAAQDVIAGSVDKIWQQATAMKNEKTQDGRPKYTDAAINAWIQGQVPLALSNVQSDSGLPDQVKNTALQGMQQFTAQNGQVTYDTLTQIERSTKQGQAQLKSMRDDMTAQTGQKREAETERHNQTMEGLAATKGADAHKKAETAHSQFEGINGDLMAAMAERGVSLPAGFRSKDQQVALLSSLIKRNPTLSVDQIAEKVESGQISLSNYKVEGRVAAGVAGKVAYAENEIEQTIPLVREASAKLPRGQFVPWNKLKQMGQEADSNPDLAEFKMYMTSLSNAYDMLAARGGTDAEKRAHGRANFETAKSPEALEAVLRAVMKEAQASGKAADATMQPANERAPGKQPQAGVNPGPSQVGDEHPPDIQSLLNKYK